MRPWIQPKTSLPYNCWFRSTRWFTPCKFYLSHEQNNTKVYGKRNRSTRLTTIITSVGVASQPLHAMPYTGIMLHGFIWIIVWVSQHPFEGKGSVTTTHQGDASSSFVVVSGGGILLHQSRKWMTHRYLFIYDIGHQIFADCPIAWCIILRLSNWWR